MSEERLCLVSKITKEVDLTSNLNISVNIVSNIGLVIEDVSMISPGLILTSAFHLEECT
jgi:hypothetical protein